ncbi:Gfo/Idh/MocA family oxidoreductase [Alphaproteobacteria bacterium]|nr:Gfo/Idh/MocA family oxidoreductase [Alphaproteobacteria bacterium]
MKNIGLIGCGNIAETYFKSQDYFNNINFVACADINQVSADECAEQNNILSMSVDDLLNNENIDIVLNLTIPKAHYEVSERALNAGKHVYSEKPMAVKLSDAEKIIQLANKNKLYFGNAPDTFLGGGIQRSRQLIDEGGIGKILTGNFIFAFSGVQTFHPNPESWFQEGGGPVIDMGPYFFTALINLLGPAKNVRARGSKFSNKRIVETGVKKGKEFSVDIPTSFMMDMEFHSGSIIQGFLSFDVQNHARNYMELYGSKGSIIVPDPNMFGGPVLTSKELGSKWEEHSVENMYLGKTNIVNHSGRSNEAPRQSNYRGVGLSEMIHSIENQKPHRCSAELSFHVLDIIETTLKAATTNKECEIKSFCSQPAYFSDNDVKVLLK